MFDCALDSWHCVYTLQWATAVDDIVSLPHSLDCFGGTVAEWNLVREGY